MISMSFAEIIAHASSLSALIPLIFYLIKVRKADRPIHIIGGLLFFAVLCDLSGYLLHRSGISTAMVFNIYYTGIFFLLNWFYYQIFFKERYKKAIFIGLVTYVLSFSLITYFVQHFYYYQNLIWMIGGIILITYSIGYFLYSLSGIPSIHLFNHSSTWINSGVLFYFSLSLFTFSMGDYLFNKENSEVTLLLWSTHNVNNIVKNVLFTIGLWMYGRSSIVS